MLQVKMTGRFVKIDASTMCQLKCPICPTSRPRHNNDIVGWGYLKFKDFKKFIDENPTIKIIELSNSGEIFLNPKIKDIITYAYQKGVKLLAVNGVNLNWVKEEVLESLVKCRLRLMNVSIDGATNETYKKYRIGGNLDTVIKNIKTINIYKKKYNSFYPILSWQFVVMGHNEHEILLAKKMAKELNMIFFPKLNWQPEYSPINDAGFVKKVTGMSVVSRDEYHEKYNKIYLLPCVQFWKSPQINWDGKLLGCCQNLWGDFGNVFEQGFETCMTSERFVFAKKMLLGKANNRSDIPCTKCSVYKQILGNPLKKKDIVFSAF
jgi:MoaA/NifB/PqqE/SkfB family radical SAM enzyme